MASINITPTMTSNNTPVPYVASASSEYSTTLSAWTAFDGGTVNGWNSNSTSTGWLTFDFGEKTLVSGIKLASRDVSTMLTSTPRNFSIQGSKNGTDFVTIRTITDQTSWTSGEYREFDFTQTVNYRFYKILVTRNNGGDRVSIGELNFLYDSEKPVQREEKVLTQRYTLPFGTKARIDELTSDLSYMLATETDGNNFGTLRIVNKNGKFVLAKATLKEELIWSGSATSGAYVGDEYSYLRVEMQDMNNKKCSHIIKANDTVRLAYGNPTSYAYIDTTFTSSGFSSVTGGGSDATSTTWLNSLLVKEVYGIY